MTTQKHKPIKANFILTPDGPPLSKVVNIVDVSRLQTQEWSRIYRELGERIEALFPDYGVDRTGDDTVDFRNLAIQLATKLYQEFRIETDPDLIDLLFPLYGVPREDGHLGDAYRMLVLVMLERQGLISGIEQQPYRHKPSDPRALLWLLADVEEINRGRREPCSDNAVIDKLIKKEPYRARWGDMNESTLRNWLVEARRLVRSNVAERPENQENEI